MQCRHVIGNKFEIWNSFFSKVCNQKYVNLANLSVHIKRISYLKWISILRTVKAWSHSTLLLYVFSVYVNKLWLLHELDFLGYTYTLETLDNENKRGLMNKLSQHIRDPKGLKVMALVCTTYNLLRPKYWEAIVNTMIALDMVRTHNRRWTRISKRLISEIQDVTVFCSIAVHLYLGPLLFVAIFVLVHK